MVTESPWFVFHVFSRFFRLYLDTSLQMGSRVRTGL